MDHKAEEKKINKVKWPQWIAGIGVSLLLLQIGMMMAWSSPYVARLTSPESQIPMTMDMASWVVSLINLGRLIGAVSGAITVNYFGTKRTILITSLPMALCWLFIIVANRVEWLYVSRFLGGIGIGKTYGSFSLYLGEIADPSIRGALVVLAMSGLSIGNLIMCIMGAYLSMEVSAGISLGLCIILMVIFIWLPESPHHFVKVKAEDKARTSLLWYHRDCDVESELEALKKFIETYNNLPFVDVIKEFRYTHIWKALILVFVLFMYSQMCGMNNVLFYMETLLRKAQVTVIDPATIVIITTATGIVSSLLSMLLIDNFGRRIMMIISSLNITLSIICLSTAFQLLDVGYNPADIQALPIFSVLYFQVSVFMGILSIPTTVLGEIFPPHIKCIAGCLSSIVSGVCAFISTSTYQPLINLVSEKYVFYIYSVLLITAVPFTIFCMPETKGKTLQQIQDDLMKKD
ncbi:facilitated trehalose transporter Tret1-like [Linepithema humile]|uniref:facilitated trehalose transporter Tret1-like n=1 Tax=Linepithema humile TaxID=83485 RepID=UPI0006232766|nr:PREDICTED: facilitated trehalose transporter Tret1-like [Linepithema humile]